MQFLHTSNSSSFFSQSAACRFWEVSVVLSTRAAPGRLSQKQSIAHRQDTRLALHWERRHKNARSWTHPQGCAACPKYSILLSNPCSSCYHAHTFPAIFCTETNFVLFATTLQYFSLLFLIVCPHISLFLSQPVQFWFYAALCTPNDLRKLANNLEAIFFLCHTVHNTTFHLRGINRSNVNNCTTFLAFHESDLQNLWAPNTSANPYGRWWLLNASEIKQQLLVQLHKTWAQLNSFIAANFFLQAWLRVRTPITFLSLLMT